MKKASEYRQHAQECRTLATKLDFGEEQRQQLLDMARYWDRLADERAAMLKRRAEAAAARTVPDKKVSSS